jgi:hypothetical protein
MDPSVALDQLRHPDTDPDERYDAAVALADWLQRGGFVPDGESRGALLAEINRAVDALVPDDAAPDAHLDAAYDDRYELDVDS